MGIPDVPGLRPLTARSAVLSALLGAHPPRLPAAALVRVGALFDIAEGTVRVALSRMVSAGDLTYAGGAYELTDRLRQRQTRQDQSRTPRTRTWRGRWEIAVVTADRRSPADRATFRQTMADLRLAELREGTWLRPDNLSRAHPALVHEQCTLFTGRPEDDPAALAATLWDLTGWSTRAIELLAALDDAEGLAGRFMVSAAVLRHLLADPLLPAELLPADWPGAALRDRHERFADAFQRTLREHLGVP
jgi:phenylacetic acid degradation operon negative regulatory protein